MRDLILGLIILAALVWFFSGQPCEFPDKPDTGMYLLSRRGAQTTKPDNSGEEIDKPAPPTEPTEPQPTEAPKPIQNPNQTSENQPQKSIDELAYECIRGLWGNGSERKRRLTEAGYDYSAVQRRVNEIMRTKS